jgi:subtilisin-like proprotein convertase family protein
LTSRLRSNACRPRFAIAVIVAIGASALALPTAASAATVTFENPTRIDVPPPPGTDGPASPYPSSIHVEGFSGPVEDVDATIRDFSHEYPSDVDILLVGPGGQNTLLLGDSGGEEPASAFGATITFDDEAATNYPCPTDPGSVSPSGTFKPTDDACHVEAEPFPPPAPSGPYPLSLSVFDGTDPNGDWHLYVFDDDTSDVGQLVNGWSLTITARTPPTDRTLTLDSNKGKVEKGRKVRLTGQIDAPLNEAGCEPNQTVELQRKKKKAPETAFATFKTVQTDLAGNFADKVRVKKTRIYRAVVQESESCDDEVSNTQKVRVQKKKAAQEA